MAVGNGELGGGWAHPAQGVIHAVKAGDILLVNTLQGHCTSCFGDALASRNDGLQGRVLDLATSDQFKRVALIPV